jgi:hypothetical protein
MSDINDAPVDVSTVAEKLGIKYPVRITESLQKALRPNDFMAGLGIQFSERLDGILSFLKGRLIPVSGGPEETIPANGIQIPYALAQGPFIREIPIMIMAELKPDDKDKPEILLSIIQETE